MIASIYPFIRIFIFMSRWDYTSASYSSFEFGLSSKTRWGGFCYIKTNNPENLFIYIDGIKYILPKFIAPDLSEILKAEIEKAPGMTRFSCSIPDSQLYPITIETFLNGSPIEFSYSTAKFLNDFAITFKIPKLETETNAFMKFVEEMEAKAFSDDGIANLRQVEEFIYSQNLTTDLLKIVTKAEFLRMVFGACLAFPIKQQIYLDFINSNQMMKEFIEIILNAEKMINEKVDNEMFKDVIFHLKRKMNQFYDCNFEIQNKENIKMMEIIHNDDVNAIQQLLNQPNVKTSDFQIGECSLIDYCSFYSAIKCFKFLLLSKHEKPKSIFCAICGGNPEIVHLCEENGCSIENKEEKDDEELLSSTLMYHKSDLFEWLIEVKHKSFRTSMIANSCAMTLNVSGLCSLIHQGYNLLIECAKYNILNLFVFASSFCENLNSKFGIEEKTILCIACENGSYDIVQFLVDNSSIDINLSSKNGDTPLHYACRSGNFESVEALYKRKDLKDDIKAWKTSNTPLHEACIIGSANIISFLLDHNVKNINESNVIFLYS
ncbi:hypothetical protein TRFO_16671 [Tritrichomonas foetus]|uniref:Uncharacterized protein n=1 Tax=Tritrichomonas foetus TaxID=1144522 RepID=A0A1J4KPL2_9EUKA|nr:hypothetical protein TRFO_16671 [Tritrichomonas foetus]|eukprot:OHT13231.1 hypothetical protein TRFO_16671 [Tritrichomonas foetus]